MRDVPALIGAWIILGLTSDSMVFQSFMRFLAWPQIRRSGKLAYLGRVFQFILLAYVIFGIMLLFTEAAFGFGGSFLQGTWRIFFYPLGCYAILFALSRPFPRTEGVSPKPAPFS